MDLYTLKCVKLLLCTCIDDRAPDKREHFSEDNFKMFLDSKYLFTDHSTDINTKCFQSSIYLYMHIVLSLHCTLNTYKILIICMAYQNMYYDLDCVWNIGIVSTETCTTNTLLSEAQIECKHFYL